MEIDALKQRRSDDNWLAHVAKYTKLKKGHPAKDKPEQYCKQEGIDCEGFKLWLEYVEKEDRYAFYRSFADIYLDRAKRSLELVKKYMSIPELRMPLMHDAIVAYVAPFKSSHGRVSDKKFSLREIENLVPESLLEIHKKIRDDRDTIVAHCDLKPRNPRVASLGGLYATEIGNIKGYSWQDYLGLMPEFEKLISAVQKELQQYNRENFRGQTYFQNFSVFPACMDKDPGPPSEKI